VPFSPLPATAAWQHRDARLGFEVAWFRPAGGGYLISGSTTAVEDGQAWIVSYEIRLDQAWRTRTARITGRSELGARRARLDADGLGHWRVDGTAASHLDGCLDVDLESSAMTNTLPVHRMSLSTGARAPAPAAYVRARDLSVERLEQEYVRGSDEGRHQRYDYTAPVFDFAGRLVYDEAGLVLDYPGIALRAL
jgi:uncharacterized protein